MIAGFNVADVGAGISMFSPLVVRLAEKSSVVGNAGTVEHALRPGNEQFRAS
jgi:hypothetical protein